MPDRERRLRAAYALVMAAPSEEHHPDASTWERLACGELPAEVRTRVFDHVVRCAACADLARALNHLAAEAPHAPASARRRARGRPVLTALTLAATLTVAIVGPRFLAPPPAVRGEPDVLRSAAGLSGPHPLAPRGPMAGPPVELTWQAMPGARAYRVLLTNAHGALLWSSAEVSGTRAPWPAQVDATPGRYHWQVLALPAAGGGPVPSEMVAFEWPASH